MEIRHQRLQNPCGGKGSGERDYTTQMIGCLPQLAQVGAVSGRRRDGQMKEHIRISGFADEIASGFDEQLEVVGRLGLRYLCLRTADGKSINDYSTDEVKSQLLPKLRAAGIGVSSLGSAIGKIAVDDENGFARQQRQLETLCQICRLLDCRYIRTFSFYIPEGKDPVSCRAQVIDKLGAFLKTAEHYDVILLNENEKELYADTGVRCRDLMDSLHHPLFRSAFDFANFVQCGEDTERCWDMLAETIEYIHIKDAVAEGKENVVCGTGDGKIALLLKRAIQQEGYEGFLTLEPHLVLFDALASLEHTPAEQVIKTNKAASGAAGFKMQYQALCSILQAI